MADMKIYSVKEIEKLTGINRKRLFDYQDIVKPIPEITQNGRTPYKHYDEEGLRKLGQFAFLRQIDMSIADIDTILNTEADSKGLLMKKLKSLEKHNHETRIRMLVMYGMLLAGVDDMQMYTVLNGTVEEYAAHIRELGANIVRLRKLLAAPDSEEAIHMKELLKNVFAGEGE